MATLRSAPLKDVATTQTTQDLPVMAPAIMPSATAPLALTASSSTSTAPIEAPVGTTSTVAANVSTTATSSSGYGAVGHSIDAVGIAPSEAVVGSGQSLTFTALISDPAVITSSVNIILIKANGFPAILGTLSPNGDGVFTLVTSAHALSLPAGNLDLRISVAFSGALKRVQSGDFPLSIIPAANTSAWMLVSPGGLFTMKLPPELSVAEYPFPAYATRDFHIQLSDGTMLAAIYVFSPQQWTNAQQTDGEVPIILTSSSTGGFVYGYIVSENDGNELGFNEGELRADLVQSLATFEAN